MDRILQGTGAFGAWLVIGLTFTFLVSGLEEPRYGDRWDQRRILNRSDEIRAQMAAGEEVQRTQGERARRERPEDVLEEADEIRSRRRVRMTGAVVSYLLGTLVFGGLGLYAYRRWGLDSESEDDDPLYE